MNKKAEEILKSLTLDQKLAQMTYCGGGQFVKDGCHFDKEKAEKLFPDGVFSVSLPPYLTPEEVGIWVGELKEAFAQMTPLPPFVMSEALHGLLSAGATSFPQSIGMGSTFDPELMYKVAYAIGKEARAFGIRMSFDPDLDLGRDPRWGRIEETYGESSYMVGEMGEAYVKGILGEDKKYLATVKHFTAHGHPESGLNCAPNFATPQELEDKYLPPFKKALDAGARALMPAYSTLNGVPCHINNYILRTILRERWGFDGVVVSDSGACSLIKKWHRAVDTCLEGAERVLESGLDVEDTRLFYGEDLKTAIKNGEISESVLDEALLRIIKIKLEMGITDTTKPDFDEISRVVNCPEHKALAREAAQKSMVLLKNDGVLPLKSGQKIAVVGPNAFSVELGDYAYPKKTAKTPVEALKERAEQSGGTVVCAQGCDVFGSDTSGFKEAEAIAETADVVVCIIGGRSMKPYGMGWGGILEGPVVTCGESLDTHDLTPGGPQLDLVRRMIATGKPTAVIMIDGRPETLFDVTENCNALVAGWYPGQEGSVALADLLFGDVNFSGKLPVTFPKHVGQIPICHDRLPSAGGYYHHPGTPENPGHDYVFISPEPEFPFGFGLGYSEICYKDITAEKTEKGVLVNVVIENKGKYDADESVLIFIRDEVAVMTQPVKKLVAAKKVQINAGETVNVSIEFDDEALMYTNYNMEKVLENGWFTIMSGNISTRILIEK